MVHSRLLRAVRRHMEIGTGWVCKLSGLVEDETIDQVLLCLRL